MKTDTQCYLAGFQPVSKCAEKILGKEMSHKADNGHLWGDYNYFFPSFIFLFVLYNEYILVGNSKSFSYLTFLNILGNQMIFILKLVISFLISDTTQKVVKCSVF